MKVSFPLSLKVSLWLLANLLLLAAAGGGFYVSQFGVGWNSLSHGVLGDQLQSIGDSIASDLQAEPESERSAIIASRGLKYGADFFLFTNNGRQIAGDAVDLPNTVREELDRSRPPRGPRSPEGRLPENSPDSDGLPSSNRRPPGGGKFLVRTATPTATWIGLRVPIKIGFGPPTPGTVIIRTDSLWTLARLLRLGPGLAIAAGALLLSLLFWLPLVGGITRALKRLNGATERIAEGEFATRVELGRRDEIGQLGHSVNRMAERLDTLVNGQKRFLGDVAHELGSPLGRLQIATEILETRADPALQPQIADVREEVQHMAALVGELLAFTKAGLQTPLTALAPVPLVPLVQRVLAREDPVLRVTAHLSEEVSALADSALLERALGNLVRNALRYAPTGAISLTVRVEHEHAVVSIADEGPGVPEAALTRLGEPFYRPDAARSTEAGGTGLGLAIVRAGIAANRGSVTFRNRTPHGFEATISLGLV